MRAWTWLPILVLLVVAFAGCTTLKKKPPATADVIEVDDAPTRIEFTPMDLAEAGAPDGADEDAAAVPDDLQVNPDADVAGEADAPAEAADDVADAGEIADVDAADPAPDAPDLAQPDAEGAEADAAGEADAAPEVVCGCTDRQCNKDPCTDKVCGFCPYGLICGVDKNGKQDQCIPDCIPNCQGHQCGPDQCNGDCLPGCQAKTHCATIGTTLGTCIPDSCKGSCAGKSCGDDGCGNPCEPGCPCGQVCSAGSCIPSPCATEHVDATTGKCVGTKATYCMDFCKDSEKILQLDCTKYAGTICNWSPDAAKYACIVPGPCTPVCHDPQDAAIVYKCGNGGCTNGDPNACGLCPTGWDCLTGVCTPVANASCGTITYLGKCVPDTGATGHVFYCSSEMNPETGTLVEQDCPGMGKTCGYVVGRATCQ